MISIKSSVGDLDRCHQSRELVLSCYLSAIRNMVHYAIELEPQTTQRHRQHLEAVAVSVSSGTSQALDDSQAAVRGLLREHRDRAEEYLAKLREELATSVAALERTLEALGQTDSDHSTKLRATLCQLRAIPFGGATAVRTSVLSAADTIEASLEQVIKQHQLAVAQFVIEIGMLHKRIDALENAASRDKLTQLFSREDMESRIRQLNAPKASILLLKANGMQSAEVQHGAEVGAELAGAFTKRLRSHVPANAIVGRWSKEGFLAIFELDQPEAAMLAKRMAQSLSGTYACLKNGKPVRVGLQMLFGVIDPKRDNPDRVVLRIRDFFGAS